MRYVILIDGEAGAYGVSIPDLPGCGAMGKTIDEALGHAVDAARDWMEAVERKGGATPAPTPIDTLRRAPDVVKALAEGAMLSTMRALPGRHQGETKNAQ